MNKPNYLETLEMTIKAIDLMKGNQKIHKTAISEGGMQYWNVLDEALDMYKLVLSQTSKTLKELHNDNT